MPKVNGLSIEETARAISSTVGAVKQKATAHMSGCRACCDGSQGLGWHAQRRN